MVIGGFSHTTMLACRQAAASVALLLHGGLDCVIQAHRWPGVLRLRCLLRVGLFRVSFGREPERVALFRRFLVRLGSCRFLGRCLFRIRRSVLCGRAAVPRCNRNGLRPTFRSGRRICVGRFRRCGSSWLEGWRGGLRGDDRARRLWRCRLIHRVDGHSRSFGQRRGGTRVNQGVERAGCSEGGRPERPFQRQILILPARRMHEAVKHVVPIEGQEEPRGARRDEQGDAGRARTCAGDGKLLRCAWRVALGGRRERQHDGGRIARHRGGRRSYWGDGDVCRRRWGPLGWNRRT